MRKEISAFALSLLFASPSFSKDAPPPKPTKAMISEQLDKLHGPNEDQKDEAYAKLREFGEPAASLVADSLSDPDPEYRRKLADLLGGYKSPGTLDRISRQLGREKELDVRRALVQALGRMGSSEIIEPLKKQLEWEKEIPVQRDILLALGESGDPHSMDIILGFAEEKENDYLSEIACSSMRNLTKQNLKPELCVWQEWWKLHRASVMKQFEEMKKQKEEAQRQAE